MSGDNERLFVTLEARVADFEKRMQQAERRGSRTYGQLQRGSRSATAAMERDMVRSTQRINAALATTSAQVGALARSFGTMFGIGIFAGGTAGIVRGIRGVISEFSDLAKVADRVGVGVESLQGLQRGFELTGVAASDLNGALEQFGRRVGQAVNGSGEFFRFAQRYGIAIRDANGQVRSQLDLLRDFADAIRALPSEAERLAAANAAFGRAGAEMVNALAQGGDALSRMIQDARDAGHIIDEELVRRAEELDDRFALLQRTVATFFKRLAVEAAAGGASIFDAFRGLNHVEQKLQDLTLETFAAANIAVELSEAILEVAQALHAFGETEAAVELRDLWQEMRDLVAEFEAGRIEADELRDGLLRMQRQAAEATSGIRAIDDVRLQSAIGQVDQLTGALNESTSAAARLNAQLREFATGNSSLAAREAAIAESGRQRDALRAFLRSEDERNAKSRERLNLERETARVMREAQEAGIDLSDAQAEAAARARIAAEERRAAEARAERSAGTGGGRARGGRNAAAEAALREAEAVDELIRSLIFEHSLIGATDLERDKAIALRRAGAAATDEQRAAIEAWIEASHREREAIRATQEAHAEFARSLEEFKAAQADAFVGLVSGALSFREALGQVIRKLGEMMAMKAFETAWSGGLGNQSGGLLRLLGFAGGGYTGPGGKHEPAGIVHRGEYVFSKRAVDALGVDRLEAMHRAARRGYAEGGHVGPAASGDAGSGDTRIINAIDGASFLEEAMRSRNGERVILNFIRANPAAVRSAMGV
jgi:hypothetical protein